MSQHSPWREQLSAELGQGFIFALVVLGLGILVYFEMPEELLLVISLLSLLLGFGCAVLLRLSPFLAAFVLGHHLDCFWFWLCRMAQCGRCCAGSELALLWPR